ncbi:hypothetical protein [Lacticaseibacillus rhamnosus]|uniref:hypothetical protein n=1 Tax=Lacticaseibacillus rhamnosus TaxID=47715 RepID=UPI00237FAA64|nr:hypothetical protein [Lacticaseibacillus rhamnosus]MDE3301574.1 hypothetical protein [Lacticaseibacillus rhamnosus]
MTARKYYKHGVVTAEQFDGSAEMARKYGAELYSESGYGYEAVEGEPDGDGYVMATLEGYLLVRSGNWIATGANGEHWPIANNIFKKTYTPLPVIPQAVAYAIEWFHQNDETIGEIWRNLYEDVADDWHECPQLREPEEWMLNNQEAFTAAWLMDNWDTEVTDDEQ